MTLTEADILDARILIVDDQQANVSLLEQLLARGGLYARDVHAWTRRPSCALHRKEHYDLILLDLQMPVMDGFQVMEVLKTNNDDRYLPVLVLTAQPGHKLRALQAGAARLHQQAVRPGRGASTRIRNMLEVRLLYKQARRLQQDAGADGAPSAPPSCARARRAFAAWPSWPPTGTGSRTTPANFTKVSGPVLEMLGIQVDAFVDEAARPRAARAGTRPSAQVLQAKIAAREPFLDFVFSRVNADGSRQKFRVSGEPMFNQSCRFLGYRGIGVEITSAH